MKNKKTIVMSTLLLIIILLGIGTIAYFRRTVNGNITGQTGNLVLIVNEADAIANESFEVILQRSEEENFIMPDDSGVFNLNIDSTGSTTDVAINISISRVNLPNNLKFYLDENHKQELTTYGTVIKKADTMTKTVPVYWFWDGSVSDEDDSEFINQTISATINVSASIAKTLYNTLMSIDKTIDTGIDFTLEASETNGEGLMLMSSTENDIYPIIYYRGDVATNNVIYAGYCWLIVRTTETGGIKLVYNGEVNSDGSCNNYSGVNGETINSDSLGVSINRIQTAFNTSVNSPVYVGYMYNDTSTYWDSSTITLDGDGYIAHLSDNTIDSTTGRHIQNLYDSNVKGVIDSWYESNLLGTEAESLLEDTVWCNDRSVIDETYSIENMANGTNRKFYFAAYTRLPVSEAYNETLMLYPNLACSRDIDKFTVDSANGNGDLTYPVGMLTADEINMAGCMFVYNTLLSYLYSAYASWTISPSWFDYSMPANFIIDGGQLYMTQTYYDYYIIRPALSLINNTYVIGGNGSFEHPYIVG